MRRTALVSWALAPLLGAASALPASAQAAAATPASGVDAPQPSSDLGWALGRWVAKGEHPIHGRIVEWRVTIEPDGRFVAEVQRSAADEPVIERGSWAAVDRDLWTFVTERATRPSGVGSASIDAYTIQSIGADAIELRHLGNGKVLRLERRAPEAHRRTP